ncbi:MAG: ABC transporter ATP-binding protein [Turneriella sp.]|nr:ABC transporter ATP-binding protein [Turneriella sp.]
MSAPLLSFSALVRWFGKLQAVSNASGMLYPGEMVALTGKNGAGKSTLLLLLAGILRAHRGSIVRNGSLHLVAHQAMAYLDLSVMENLRLAALLADRKRSELAALLTRWGILHRKDRPLRALSRGELQRFLLARAELATADVLLLDEPFTGLDAAGEAVLWDFLESRKKQGAAVLVCEHSPQRAKNADRIWRMEAGRLRS